jgi:hypothetical protein
MTQTMYMMLAERLGSTGRHSSCDGVLFKGFARQNSSESSRLQDVYLYHQTTRAGTAYVYHQRSSCMAISNSVAEKTAFLGIYKKSCARTLGYKPCPSCAS